MKWAQDNLPHRWGLKNIGSAIPRAYDASHAERNRRASREECLRKYGPRPWWADCDEFPFARIYASTADVGAQLTSVKYVVSADKRGAGRRYWDELPYWRGLDWEWFWVEIVP